MSKVLFFAGGFVGIFLSLFFRDLSFLNIRDELSSQIFWQIRLPRLLLTYICGGGLSIVGLFYQSLFKNDLASPYTLGVASGASFGASFVLWLGLSLSFSIGPFSFDTISIGAFLGALSCVALILSLAHLKKNHSPHFLILAGVMISFIFSSAIMLIQFLAGELGLQKMVYWLMGDLGIVGLESLSLLYPLSFLVLFYAYKKRDLTNILSMGDRFAISKGINAQKERKKIFITLSLFVSYIVSLCGPIGFVGLMVPHMVKERFGANLKGSFFPSFFGGGFFLVWCDFFSRSLFTQMSVPIGVITSFLGGGFFLYLLLKRR
ncbi:MAG: iron ABC transporter [Halobacteriovoraceae bacterium]|nr:iron ABC transporter [Halobacteriovoraceae bacterium]|tara:strand:+ start:135998 stop:136957 length:960 start_codon:yes stop_codon:yes gene_type:complete